MAELYDAVDLVCHLVRQHEAVAAVRVFRPRLPGLVQDRVNLTPCEHDLVERALSWRDTTRSPFWDSVLLHAEACHVPPCAILDAVQFHNAQCETSFDIPVDDDLGGRLRASWKSLAAHEAVVISSSVLLHDRTRLHIPMIDFHSVADERTERLVRQVVRRIWPAGGYLVASGKSYHFYGEGLIDDAGLVRFLATALLYAPVVDRAWVAHQLLETACGLRISPRLNYPRPPMVTGRIEPA